MLVFLTASFVYVCICVYGHVLVYVCKPVWIPGNNHGRHSSGAIYLVFGFFIVVFVFLVLGGLKVWI